MTVSVMIWALFGACIAGCALSAFVGDRAGRRVFVIGALPLAAMTLLAAVARGRDTAPTAEFTWVAGLDLTIAMRLDDFTSVLVMLVAGIGVGVMVYAAGYFSPSAEGLGRFAATLLAFATAMIGLVMADTAWTVFVFWELTSITSFLLVGHKRTDATARTAARRALVITASGGLVLLAGFVLLGDLTSARLSELGAVDGPTATAAAVLVMIAAATKSAQFPFHVWLPGAMAAPTPVSAYLHSATMVKAGVVLVAVASPAFAGNDTWKILGITFGALSMVWGAVGALRQTDAKLILAWGTVSQLGLMFVLLALGNGKATFAAVSILVAHAIFKAALFMVVGEIDIRTGTRDIAELGGLASSMPIAFGVALVSAASMAGVPPMLGFPAKESAVEAALGLAGFERTVALTVIVGGSILTVAYTVRFMLAVFGGRRPDDLVVAPRRLAMTVPAAVLGAATVIGFVALDGVTTLVRAAAVRIDDRAEVYSLLRWPGLTDAFLVSAGIVAAGTVLGAVLARRTSVAPAPVGARRTDRLIDGTVRTASIVAARVQHGSLPGYVLTIVGATVLAATPFLFAVDLGELRRWDNAGQAALAALVAAGAIAATIVGSRLGAALVLGGVGLAMTGLFVVQGAPDLVLTQLLVETVIVVGFVFGLGRLTQRFPSVGRLWLSARISIAVLAAATVSVALIAAGSAPVGTAPIEALTEQAVGDGGGNNVVNVILTDIRALDTLGEVVVLIVVAIGILSLTRGRRSTSTPVVSRDVVKS